MASFSFTIIPDTTGPVITPLNPVQGQTAVPLSTHFLVRLTDDNQVDLDTLDISIDGTPYVMDGDPVNGASMTATANDGNGYDIELVRPGLLAAGAHSVTVTVSDVDTGEPQEI